jgi:hypothetical protein
MIQTFNVIVVIWINVDVFKKKELHACPLRGGKNFVFAITFLYLVPEGEGEPKSFWGRGTTKNKISD